MNISDYYDLLVGTDITGVKSLASVPSQINTATLPCKYVRYVSSGGAIATLASTNGLPTHIFDVVFIIEPTGQNTNVANQTLCISIAEQIISYAEQIGSLQTYNTAFEINSFSGSLYWSLITTIEILGD